MLPITFSFPKEKITDITEISLKKTKILSFLIPGKPETYIYETEIEYYKEYQSSFFALTREKAGWDCLRHYEIIANGCIPFFPTIDTCPPNTLYNFPKKWIEQGNCLYKRFSKYKNVYEISPFWRKEYIKLLETLQQYMKLYLTTDKVAQNILIRSKNYITNMLFLSGCSHPDYLRCLTLHGFKVLFGEKCHDYPRINHLYKTNQNLDSLYGKGMTYTNLLSREMHNDEKDLFVEQDIIDKKYDIIVYGNIHRGMPFFEQVSKSYLPNEIILLCGEDIHLCREGETFLKQGYCVFCREL
jgi:hypothetical protein